VSTGAACQWPRLDHGRDTILDAGDAIVALGRYGGSSKATGKAMNPQMAHVWRVVDGKSVAFQQYVDTLHVDRATG